MDGSPELACSSISLGVKQLRTASMTEHVSLSATDDLESDVLPVAVTEASRCRSPSTESGSGTSDCSPRRAEERVENCDAQGQSVGSVVGLPCARARQRLTHVVPRTDLLTKVMQQNVRLKQALRDVVEERGQTMSQYLDMRERDDVITQLRAELAEYGRRYNALYQLTRKLLERQNCNTTELEHAEV